jgi:cob(I)alamin adenosyltransferase
MNRGEKEKLNRGFVQIYTGNGKGKTTAALGLALRAMGRGLKTYIGQFIKGQQYGELEAVKSCLGLITIEQYGRDTFLHVHKKPTPADFELARKGLNKAREAMLSGKYNIIVLDEIITAHYFRLFSVDDLLKVISEKPVNVELVMTGRHAPRKLIEVADLVTSMNAIKHYHKKGVVARDGIER